MIQETIQWYKGVFLNAPGYSAPLLVMGMISFSATTRDTYSRSILTVRSSLTKANSINSIFGFLKFITVLYF